MWVSECVGVSVGVSEGGRDRAFFVQVLQPQTKEELMEEESEGEGEESEGEEGEGGEEESGESGCGEKGEGDDDSEEEEENESMEEEEVDAQFREDVMKALGSAAAQSEDEVTQK